MRIHADTDPKHCLEYIEYGSNSDPNSKQLSDHLKRQVPFLSAGAESVGSRTERCRGHSQLSGDYVVEDVQIGNQLYRSA